MIWTRIAQILVHHSDYACTVYIVCKNLYSVNFYILVEVRCIHYYYTNIDLYQARRVHRGPGTFLNLIKKYGTLH